MNISHDILGPDTGEIECAVRKGSQLVNIPYWIWLTHIEWGDTMFSKGFPRNWLSSHWKTTSWKRHLWPVQLPVFLLVKIRHAQHVNGMDFNHPCMQFTQAMFKLLQEQAIFTHGLVSMVSDSIHPPVNGKTRWHGHHNRSAPSTNASLSHWYGWDEGWCWWWWWEWVCVEVGVGGVVPSIDYFKFSHETTGSP